MDSMRSDNRFIELDPTEKLIWSYLLTNEKVGICGIYELPLKKIAYETWIDRDMVIKILTRFEKDKKCFYRDGFIFLINFFKNLWISSKDDNVRKWVEREIKELWNHLNAFKEEEIEETCKDLIRGLQGAYKDLGILYLTLLNFTLLNSNILSKDNTTSDDVGETWIDDKTIEEQNIDPLKTEKEIIPPTPLYWNQDINSLLGYIKATCKANNLPYWWTWTDRNYAKHILSNKFSENYLQYNMDLYTFIEFVIRWYNLLEYVKPVNSAKNIYYNWSNIVQQLQKKQATSKTWA